MDDPWLGGDGVDDGVNLDEQLIRHVRGHRSTRSATARTQRTTMRAESQSPTSSAFYPPAHAPWIPGNPASGKSMHVSVLAQRVTGEERAQRDTRSADTSGVRRTWRDVDTAGETTGCARVVPRTKHQPGARKGHGSQLDTLADLVYDRLMGTSHKR